MDRQPVRRIAVVLTVAGCILLGSAALAGVVATSSITTRTPAITYPGVADLIASTTTTATEAVFQARRVDREDDEENWVTVGQPVRSPSGRFVMTDVPKVSTYYRAIIGGEITSPTVLVGVHVPMGAPTLPKSLRAGVVTTVRGTIRPYHPLGYASIRLDWQRKDPRSGKWKAAPSTPATVTVEIDNDMTMWTYRLKPLASRTGNWRVRSFHECVRHRASYSRWVTYKVTP